MTPVAPQLSHRRSTLAPRGELLPSRAGKGGTYGVLWVIKSAVAPATEGGVPPGSGPTTEPEPDLALVARSEDDYWTAHPSAADTALVIEVSDSSLAFDLETKARLHAGASIPH